MNKGIVNRINIRHGFPYCKYRGKFGRVIESTMVDFAKHYLIKFPKGDVISTFNCPEKIYYFKPLFKKKINIYG